VSAQTFFFTPFPIWGLKQGPNNGLNEPEDKMNRPHLLVGAAKLAKYLIRF